MLKKLTGGPAQIVSMAIAFILQDTLDLNEDAFKPCPGNGMYALSDLPLAASISIQLVPFLGDVFMLMEPVTCLQAGCKNGMTEEGGLCYKPCDPGYKSDGGLVCYKEYPEFQNNGQLHTVISITCALTLEPFRPSATATRRALCATRGARLASRANWTAATATARQEL